MNKKVHTYSIIDDDDKPNVFFQSKATNTKEDGPVTPILLHLSNPIDEDIKVDYTVSGGNAKQGEDFFLENGSITFKANSTDPIELTPSIRNNNKLDGNRSFKVTLVRISDDKATLGHITENTFTIEDDEKPLPKLGFEISETHSPHGNSTRLKPIKRYVKVALSTPAQRTITQKYEIIENGKPIHENFSTLTFRAGSKIVLIDLNITDIDLKPVVVETADSVNFASMASAIIEKINSLNSVNVSDKKLFDEMVTSLEKPEPDTAEPKQTIFEKILLATSKKLAVVTDDIGKKDSAEDKTKDAKAIAKTDKDDTDKQFVEFQGALKKKNAAEVTRSNKLELIKFLEGRGLATDNPQVVQGQVVQFLQTKLNGIPKAPPPSPPILEFEKDSSRNLESIGSPILNVKLSKAGTSTITVQYKTEGPAGNGAGKDFQLQEGTLVFTKGVVSMPIPNLMINPNTKDENDRTFVIKLSEPTGAQLGKNKEHVYRIIDDDGEPTIYFLSEKSENNESLTPAKIKIAMSNLPATGDVTVDYKVGTSTATKDKDFTLTDGTHTFSHANNELEKTIELTIVDDIEKEGSENVTLNLSNPKLAKLGMDHRVHTYTIQANDGGEMPAKSPTTYMINDEKMKLNDTIALVQAHLPKMEFPIPSDRPDLDSKQVMDQLIDTLKYEHIAAVREGGENSGAVQHIQEALDAAQNHRADMVAIRPALAYLRNSFPASSLQDDADLGWKNLLSERMWRGLFGECPDCDERNRRRINREIDKQYWQNINRIRVSGGGNTNYVISKDDIGNWNVKNFSANPAPIIQSAKNLAMFGLSGGLGENLIARNNAPRAADGTALPNANTNVTPTLLERQISNFKNEFNTQTENDLKALRVEMGALPATVHARWEANKKIITNETTKTNYYNALINDDKVEVAEAELKKSSEDVKQGDETSDQLIQRQLSSIIIYHNDTKTALEALKKDAEQDKVNAMDAAIEELKLAVSSKLSGLIAKRLKTVETYETAIAVLNKSITDTPATPAIQAPAL
ncbi:MAG: hypothetical protein HOF21_10005 [Nitrospina sp.]|nr:hypothetical protein [Nitrospina sp.]